VHNKNFPFMSDSYLKNDTRINSSSPYKVRNMIPSSSSTYTFAQETSPGQAPEQAPPQGDTSALPAEPGAVPESEPEKVGYISIGVFTASGALPVEDAVITVYTLDEEGEENVISHQVTDANGQVPIIELPISHDEVSPLQSSEYYFGTYNLRIQAINYYTVNILDFRVFPNTTTNFAVDLIPVAAEPTEVGPDTTYVIPPSPVDISND